MEKIIPHNKNKNKQIAKIDFNMHNLKVKFDGLKAINEQNVILDNYEILFNILRYNLKLNLD